MKTLLKQVRLTPSTVKQVKGWTNQTLRLKPWHHPPSPHQVKAVAGLAFSGMVLVHLSASSLPEGGRGTQVSYFDPALWQSTGLVRQSVVDLYRAHRFDLEASTASSATVTTTPVAAKEKPSLPGPQTLPNTDLPTPLTTPPVSYLPPPRVPTQSVATSAFDPRKTIDTNLEMRVAVAKGVSQLAVATSVEGYLVDLNGQNYCNLSAEQSLVLRPQGVGIVGEGCQLTNAAWLEPGEGGYIYVGDRWYKGRVLLMASGDRLTAVNFVLLHDYLSSVVGSEMYVNWPLESLKAQAVAARSYALVHHVRNASRPYDLDNTQRYQAYLGIGKETNTTQTAVVTTTGEFISHNGGIVESLYAASDEIVASAHNGNGMSQTGAMELANQGYTYTEILGNYYPGTSLSRLVVQ